MLPMSMECRSIIEMLPRNAESTVVATKQLGLNRLEFNIDCLIKQMGLSSWVPSIVPRSICFHMCNSNTTKTSFSFIPLIFIILYRRFLEYIYICFDELTRITHPDFYTCQNRPPRVPRLSRLLASELDALFSSHLPL